MKTTFTVVAVFASFSIVMTHFKNVCIMQTTTLKTENQTWSLIIEPQNLRT